MKEKRKLTEDQKALLIFSGEFLLFAVIFIILGFLKAFRVIQYNDTRRIVFNYITLAGGLYGITDFFWTLLSPKKRAKNCMLDKVFTLVLAIYIITVDIIALVSKNVGEDFYVLSFAAAIFYAGLMFVYMGIYHYFKPLPSFLEELEKMKQEEEQERLEKEKEIQNENEKN